MEDFKCINSKTNVLSIASSINKSIKSIAENKPKSSGKQDSSAATNEIELLKSLCKSDNSKTAQLAVQAFFQLVTCGTLDLGQVLGILVTALANSSPAHSTAVSNGIFELLLLDLRRRLSVIKAGKYVCQFDIKPPQHPLILLLGNKDVSNMLYFGTKIQEICLHHDQLIRKNSVELLRPVFLYVFCNVVLFPETQKMWRALLKCAVNDETAVQMIYEIISWSKTSTSSKCLFTNNLLLEALEFLPDDNKFDSLRSDLCLYLAAVTKELIGFNFDPSENFLAILSALHVTKDDRKNLSYSVLLMVLANLLQSLAPAYVLGLMRIVRFLLDAGCNRLSQYMLLDGAVQLLGQQTFIHNYLESCDYILKTVLNINNGAVTEDRIRIWASGYNHPDLAKYQHVSTWWTQIEEEKLSVDAFLEKVACSTRFSDKINLLLKGLFYMSELPYDSWKKVFSQLLLSSKANEDAGSKMVTPILFSLANDGNPQKRLFLLQSLASMGAKDHVLGVLKALSKDVDRATSLDLYLRLWKAEPRTYPFLYDILKDTSRRPRDDLWETTLARAYTIREICLIKPQQHGADLVNLFSEILSHPEDADHEAAVALAIDAIASLCENRVVNIVSTWKVLGFKFTHEKRPRIIRSLCKFFANVPSIKVNSIEQEKLVNEIIVKLWQFVTDFDDREVIIAALESLKSFPPEIMNIFHVPDIFRQGISLPSEEDDTVDAKQIPGECWIQLVQYVNHSAIEEAGDLVAHHIRNEMQTYRGGVYQTPEGRPEPSSLRYLPRKSIVASIVHHLIGQSKIFQVSEGNELFLINLLRVLAQKYPKPIPPLDWCFLHEYFHYFDMKKYCLSIAIKQSPHSGTAKRLVENYLDEMVDADMVEDSVLVIFESLHVITETVQTDIYKKFVHLSLQFLLERSEDGKFKGQDPFGRAVEFLKVTVSMDFQNVENFEYLCEALENLFSRFELDSKIFNAYIAVLSMLPPKYCTSLLKPSTWIDKQNMKKLEKVIYLQFSIHKHNQLSTEMHLYGLSDILKTVARLDSRYETLQRFFQSSFLVFVSSIDNQKALNEWIIELIGYIQSDLAEKQPKQMKEIMFMVDVFMMAVINLSGYGCLLGEDATLDCLDKRLSVFPPSLIMVFQQNLWREIENKIYEFLYHLYNHPLIPAAYAECFRNGLVCCKEQTYLQQPKAWPKFVSLRRTK